MTSSFLFFFSCYKSEREKRKERNLHKKTFALIFVSLFSHYPRTRPLLISLLILLTLYFFPFSIIVFFSLLSFFFFITLKIGSFFHIFVVFVCSLLFFLFLDLYFEIEKVISFAHLNFHNLKNFSGKWIRLYCITFYYNICRVCL